MPGSENRRHARVALATNASLRSGDRPLGSFAVVNLSVGGVLLAGAAPAEPGTRVRVGLRLAPERVVEIGATLGRARPLGQGTAFALTFQVMETSERDALDAAVNAVVEHTRAAPVLVVDDSREICQALRMEIERRGQGTHAVVTPLEAVQMLEQPNSVRVAIVDLVLGQADGLDLLGYLAEQHPHVRRVLMSGHAHPAQLALARRPGDPRAAHEVLAKPWSAASLSRALAV